MVVGVLLVLWGLGALTAFPVTLEADPLPPFPVCVFVSVLWPLWLPVYLVRYIRSMK